MPSIILHPHEAMSAAAGTLGLIVRPVTTVAGMGQVTEFQKSTTRGYDWIMRDIRLLWNDLRHDDLLQRAPFGAPGTILACRETRRGGGRAVRSWLKVRSVDVKRIQEMTEEDARAWGSFLGRCPCPEMQRPPRPGLEGMFLQTACHIHGVEVKHLWDSRFSRRGLSWDKNPWCWFVNVERAERPEDHHG